MCHVLVDFRKFHDLRNRLIVQLQEITSPSGLSLSQLRQVEQKMKELNTKSDDAMENIFKKIHKESKENIDKARELVENLHQSLLRFKAIVSFHLFVTNWLLL